MSSCARGNDDLITSWLPLPLVNKIKYYLELSPSSCRIYTIYGTRTGRRIIRTNEAAQPLSALGNRHFLNHQHTLHVAVLIQALNLLLSSQNNRNYWSKDNVDCVAKLLPRLGDKGRQEKQFRALYILSSTRLIASRKNTTACPTAADLTSVASYLRLLVSMNIKPMFIGVTIIEAIISDIIVKG